MFTNSGLTQFTTITMKLPYVITYVCQNFGVLDICGQIPIFYIFYLLLSIKHKDLTRKSCVFICYFIGSLVEIVLSEAATGGVLYKKVFLKFAKLTGKYNCQSLF